VYYESSTAEKGFSMLNHTRDPRRWSRSPFALLALLTMALGGAACNDDEGMTGPSGGPYTLTFSLDASYQGPHGGQSINIAVLRSSDGVMVAGGDGIVSATQAPSFSFATAAVLEAGMDYEVHYWIDSNFGGGTPGDCDTRNVDHQWRVEIPSVSGDVTLTESHDPSMTEDVCSTFS
jgi:hypothetical protein